MELSYFAIIIGAIFVNNVVLAQFLGICPFLGVSSKVETSLGMGAAVTFVMAIASVVAWLIQTYVLVPLHIEYMQTIVFILVIAALVQMVEIILKKVSPSLYQALGIFLPLITTNCAVLGVAILMIQKEFDLLQSVTYSVATALGFGLALVLFAGIRERLEFEDVPEAFRGVPVALITAGILAMAFMASPGSFSGESEEPVARPVSFCDFALPENRFDRAFASSESWGEGASLFWDTDDGSGALRRIFGGGSSGGRRAGRGPSLHPSIRSVVLSSCRYADTAAGRQRGVPMRAVRRRIGECRRALSGDATVRTRPRRRTKQRIGANKFVRNMRFLRAIRYFCTNNQNRTEYDEECHSTPRQDVSGDDSRCADRQCRGGRRGADQCRLQG